MKKHLIFWIVPILCLCYLAGCGAPAEKAPEPEAAPQAEPEETPEVQELTAIELQGFFEKAYEAKGNCLESPEQLALEVAELETLTADAALPEDYEAQYKDWRAEKVNSILGPIQAKYDEFIAELPQCSGPIPGACYADYVDFEGDGCPELLVIFLEEDPNYDGYDDGFQGVVTVYAFREGDIKKIGEELMDFWSPGSVGLCKAGKLMFLHMFYGYESQDTWDGYYSVKDGLFSALDIVERCDPMGAWIGNYEYTSFDKSISEGEYNSIQSKYSETEPLVSFHYTNPSVHSRGILPEPSPDVLHRAALIKALDDSGAQYACSIDFDQDGSLDLITVETIDGENIYGEWGVPGFCLYHLVGTEIKRTTFNNLDFGVDIVHGGVYRRKSDGKLFLHCQNFYDGVLFTTYQYANLTEFDSFSDSDFEQALMEDVDAYEFTEKGLKDFENALNRYEVIAEFGGPWLDDNTSFSTSTAREKLINP